MKKLQKGKPTDSFRNLISIALGLVSRSSSSGLKCK